MTHTLNITNALLAYQDQIATNNPQLRDFDYTRRLDALQVANPSSGSRTLAPGEAYTLFDGSVSTGLDGGTSVIAIALLSGQDARYRLSVTSGPAGFRTARSPSAIVACTVAVNNNATATFDFTGATLTGIVVGDIMRIKGAVLYDTAPYAFNPLNAGLWKIIGVAGTVITAIRPDNDAFSAVVETVATATADVQFYSAAGVQVGNKFDVVDSLSEVSRRTYVVADVTPTTIDFVSAVQLPEESGVTYIASSINFYNNAKRMVYIETDQDAAVRLNGASGDHNRIVPIIAGDPKCPGYFNKWGDTFSAVVVNKSVNPLRLQYLTAE